MYNLKYFQILYPEPFAYSTLEYFCKFAYLCLRRFSCHISFILDGELLLLTICFDIVRLYSIQRRENLQIFDRFSFQIITLVPNLLTVG